MINKNIFIGFWLLSVAALTSCNNEEFIDNGNSNRDLSTYTLSASAYTPEGSSNSRANVKEDGKTFFWNTGDELTIWNGQEGFTFKAIDTYSDNEMPLNKVEFTGEASLEDGKDVWGIYPKKEDATIDNIFVFNLPEVQEQTTASPAMQPRMFMYGQGKVSGTTINNMEFKHLTGIMQFSLTNKRGNNINIEYVRISANANVFPYKVVVEETGEVVYSEEKSEIRLNLNQTLANDETLNGYMTLLPTQSMTEDTELSFYAKITGDEEEFEIRKGKISEMYGVESVMAKDNYNYSAGKRYGISKNIQPAGGDLGYTDNGGNSYTIHNANGFINIMAENAIITNSAVTITLDQNINFGGQSINAIADFKATLDGKGFYIENYQINNENFNDYSLFMINNGTIKNLTIKNVTLNASIAQDNNVASLFVGTNKGSINNCSFDGINLTLPSGKKAKFGVVTGQNNGTIADINIVNSSVTINHICDAGIISGVNTKVIANCYVKATVTLDKIEGAMSGAANFGGLVGWANGGSIYASGTNLTIKANSGSKVGGIVGANGGNIELTYSSGSITGNAASIAGFVCSANSNKIKNCYTTISNYGFAKDNSAGTFENCYTTGTASQTGINAQATAESIKSGLENQTATIESVTYKFVANTDSDNDIRPLIIEKQ